MKIQVYFLLLPGYVLMEFAGAADALRLANEVRPLFDLHCIGPEAQPRNALGMATNAVSPLPERLPPGSWLIIPGLSDTKHNLHTAAANAATRWLAATHDGQSRLITVCSAALLAARAGLLTGRHCTTHHRLLPALRAAAPQALVEERRIFVIDGEIATSAGVSTGLDLMLELISQAGGPKLALEVASEMVVWLRRDGAAPQLSPYLSHRTHMHPAVHRVQDAIAADPTRDWPSSALADIACVSPRHLNRIFKEATGISPLDYRQQLQLAQVETLLSQPGWPLERIAEASGFGSARAMRRVWQNVKKTALRP